MRSFIAFTLLVVAAALGFGAMGAHWMDRLAHTPAPMQRIVGPLVQDTDVVESLTTTLATEMRQALPEAVTAIPVIGEQIEALVSLAVDAALADPAMQRAWNESINRSRIAYIAELHKMHEDQSLESPTIWFDLTPVADLGKARLVEAAPEAAQPLLQQVEVQQVRLPLGQPSASISANMSDALDAAGYWPWGYLAAGTLAAVALFVGSTRGRWVALALAGAVALAGLWFGRSVAERISFPGGESLAAAIRTVIVNGGAQSFIAFTQPATYVAVGAIAVGVVGFLLAHLVRRR